MKYMGGKARLAKHLLPIILADRQPGQTYVEPFVGGCNMIDKVRGPRIGADSHRYLIAMWRAIRDGWQPPTEVSREKYNDVRVNHHHYDDALVGWVGFACSYSGKWFGGYAGKTRTKLDTVRDYQREARDHVLKQAPFLATIGFAWATYDTLNIPPNSIIYCDPPYSGTTEYNDSGFDSVAFWEWCRQMTAKGHKVFVSEYKAPSDFVCVFEAPVRSSLSANGKGGGSKESVERLFSYA